MSSLSPGEAVGISDFEKMVHCRHYRGRKHLIAVIDLGSFYLWKFFCMITSSESLTHNKGTNDPKRDIESSVVIKRFDCHLNGNRNNKRGVSLLPETTIISEESR
jgi:hypothetical protein